MLYAAETLRRSGGLTVLSHKWSRSLCVAVSGVQRRVHFGRMKVEDAEWAC